VSGDTPAAMLQLLVPPFSSKAVLARANRERLGHVVRAVAEGKVKVNLAARLALADAEQAHALSRTGRVAGKLVLLP
jgi:NADPH:quinone reductase-like Zn-dependent oxidoreductase